MGTATIPALSRMMCHSIPLLQPGEARMATGTFRMIQSTGWRLAAARSMGTPRFVWIAGLLE
jgi:hypothetical protein